MTEPAAHRGSHRDDRTGERGMVTAETAVVLPFVLAIAFVLVWAVSLGVVQVDSWTHLGRRPG